MNEILCPVCEQDYVVRAKIKPLDIVVMICPECDALWSLDTPISRLDHTWFDEFVERYGVTATRENIVFC